MCIWISDRLDGSPAPAVSLGYHSWFICRSALLCFMAAARTQRSIQKEGGRKRERVRTVTRLPNKWQLLVCMMNAPGYDLTERAYPCTCGVELWLIFLRVCKCVFHCVLHTDTRECVCAWLDLQQYVYVVYGGYRRLQVCYRRSVFRHFAEWKKVWSSVQVIKQVVTLFVVLAPYCSTLGLKWNNESKVLAVSFNLRVFPHIFGQTV